MTLENGLVVRIIRNMSKIVFEDTGIRMSRKITSRYLTFLLRHHPEEIGLKLNQHGWTKINQLVVCLRKHDCDVLHSDLLQIFALDPKRRFKVSEDGTEVRAAQGHSIDVDLGLTASEPPALVHELEGFFRLLTFASAAVSNAVSWRSVTALISIDPTSTTANALRLAQLSSFS